MSSQIDSSDSDPSDEFVAELLDRALRGERLDPDALVQTQSGWSDARRDRARKLAQDLLVGGSSSGPGSGPRVFANYEIVRELGRGGQGVVYLARDLRLERRVALKVLSRSESNSFTHSAQTHSTLRLRREAEIASKLDHPGICVVYEMGVEDGWPFIAMRYVEGETLAQLIAAERHPAQTAPPVPGRARLREIDWMIELVERAARTAHTAHLASVIHRDLKPGNVMVTPTGDPVILDFGLACDSDSDAATLTVSGQLIGSPAYMAPEQVDPTRGAVDARSDVYALGAMLYECLTLQRPFEAPTRDALYRAILSEAPQDPRVARPEISHDLSVVLATALEKDRDRRYKSALDLADELRRVRVHEPILARPAGPWLRLRRWAQRNPGLAALMVTALVLLLATIAVLQLMLTREREHFVQVERERGVAQAERLLAESTATLATDPALALSSALEAARFDTPAPLEVDARLVAALLALREESVMQLHDGEITDVRASEDRVVFATSGKDLGVKVWNAATLECVRELPVHVGAPRISTGADGKWLVTTSDADPPRLWDLESGEARVLDLPAGGTVLLSPTSEHIAHFAGEALEILSRDPSADAPRYVITAGQLGPFDSVIWSPDGAWTMAAHGDWIRLCSLDESAGDSLVWGRVRGAPPGAFSGPGAGLAVLLTERGVVVFDLALGVERRVLTAPAHSRRRAVQVTRIDDCGERVLMAYKDGGADLLDASSGALIAPLDIGAGVVRDASFSADGARILVEVVRSSTLVCATDSGARIAELATSDVRTFALWPASGQTAPLTFHRSGVLRRWSLEARVPRVLRVLPTDHPAVTRDCAASADRMIIGAGEVAYLRAPESFALIGELRGHSDALICVDISADGAWIATGSADHTARVWRSIASREAVRVYSHGNRVWSAKFSPDGRWLATAGDEGRIRFFEPAAPQLEPVFELPTSRRGLRCLDFDATGQRLVSVSERDGCVRVWDVAARRELASHRTGSNALATRRHSAPHSAAFHPDGVRVAIATFDGRLLLWDTRSNSLGPSREFDLQLNDLEFSPDGALLAVCGPGALARLLSVEDLRDLAILPTQGSVAQCLSFVGAGRELMTLEERGWATIWPLDVRAAARATLDSIGARNR